VLYQTTAEKIGGATTMNVGDLQRRMWGELFKRTLPIVSFYHADLFEDARFLITHLTEAPTWGKPFQFLWACRETGTDISLMDENGRGSEWFEASRPNQTVVYTIFLRCDEQDRYVAYFTPIQ